MAWGTPQVGAVKKENASGEGQTSVPLNLPTYSEGDTLIAIGCTQDWGGSYGINATPSGYTEIASWSTSGKKQVSVCAKVAGAGESAPAFGAESSTTFIGVCFSASGGPASITVAGDINDVTPTTATGSTHPYITAALNPVTNGDLILYVCLLIDNVWTTGASGELPNSTTAILSSNTDSNYSGLYANIGLVASYKIQTTAANLSASQFTDNDASNCYYATIALALKSGDIQVSSGEGVVAVLTEGGYTEVELETPEWVVPVLTQTDVAGLTKANSDSVVPVLTQARGTLAITGTFAKSNAESIVPVVSESNSYAGTGAVASSDSVVAVVAESNAKVSDYIEALSTDSVIPVVTEANTDTQTGFEAASAESIVPVLAESNAYVLADDDKASTDSIVPVIAEVFGITQYAGLVEWDVLETLIPTLTIVNAVTGESDEVDGITFIARATGHIRISPV